MSLVINCQILLTLSGLQSTHQKLYRFTEVQEENMCAVWTVLHNSNIYYALTSKAKLHVYIYIYMTVFLYRIFPYTYMTGPLFFC